MANTLLLILSHPLQALLFTYSFFSQVLLALLRRLLLPHFPVYQPLRLQVHRAYLAAAALTFPNLTHRLPVGKLSAKPARKVDEGVPAYLIPGKRQLSEFARGGHGKQRCVVLFAHGGGYARGEARMYLKYMERWVAEAARKGLDLAFFSVEYPLSTQESHPAQRNTFIQVYRFLLDSEIGPENVVFMGDSAGGGLSILAGLELGRLNLPQPAATVLISPWVDMTLKAHRGGNPAVESDYFLMANKAVPALVQLFIGDRPPDSPDVNPLCRQPEELKDLSPQLIFTGGAEFARTDSEKWAELCQKAGVEHKLIIEWAQLHVYAVGSKFTHPAVRGKTDDMIIEWVKAHVAQ
ncbi:uncharacterized protein A1O5_10438 [Cladophialophora psammophila CBS 110553]|uniref:Alpha/beta hydrolase fold-3 domain-containing protein n=1 Tax=Cladophialophora psammophila CBS 110553 TaxID=1182543 RepID=W9WNP7_9EURO|nr:uncharacterized protein A1O5_10438 [Cladophialophora psammophila CBS 110553]EXJ66286.1 hypothetical protein A1O5_10438 [Cladophialophora psammophila CBS 110553]